MEKGLSKGLCLKCFFFVVVAGFLNNVQNSSLIYFFTVNSLPLLFLFALFAVFLSHPSHCVCLFFLLNSASSLSLFSFSATIAA